MKVAVLIDLDNIKNENSLSRIIVELSNKGELLFKYGFYSNFNDKNIKRILQQYGIIPVMFPSFVDSKSCSDISLTIKALDLLSNIEVDCFAIVSNDSDFISLSNRLRESNKKTILVTDKQSINKEKYNYFDEGIDIFDLLNPKSNIEEILVSSKELSVDVGEKNEINTNQSEKIDIDNSIVVDNIKYVDYSSESPLIRDLLTKIQTAFNNIAIENNFARLSMLVEYLSKKGKKFDPRDYGHTSKRIKEFFERKLNQYFDIETKNSTTFIKFKTEVMR
ncbi:NYN domain [Acholeplasma oculi]|uniref:Limkain-b1-type protein n=1 Tax=Acholeplasma oculi TaxID=35623 RepID=A0A061AFH2_9MOLU|nr:NYN domain-containing protein [Acholeplasma oculi]CDR30281.1 Limkain-b1-type protein [Acholeplasma oculi]SKC43357.1 TIGR00288 family protein [Acholeplasma oculi]SUT88716.1 NYN domain [Acholeplasma oculi]